MNPQPAILPPVSKAARYISFSLLPSANPKASMIAVESLEVDTFNLVGIGNPLVRHWGKALEGLRDFPALSGAGIEIPSTQHALWCWLRGEDRGDLLHRGRAITRALEESFRPKEILDGFKFGEGEPEPSLGPFN